MNSSSMNLPTTYIIDNYWTADLHWLFVDSEEKPIACVITQLVFRGDSPVPPIPYDVDVKKLEKTLLERYINGNLS